MNPPREYIALPELPCALRAGDVNIGDGFTIGSKQGKNKFTGAIKCVRVDHHALSQSQIASCCIHAE
ncbi:MAG: hypothetical protein JXR97_16480 [Planctomycetes bacterium]|nr:hypothetical protein [Planctomycetota bacterium]